LGPFLAQNGPETALFGPVSGCFWVLLGGSGLRLAAPRFWVGVTAAGWFLGVRARLGCFRPVFGPFWACFGRVGSRWGRFGSCRVLSVAVVCSASVCGLRWAAGPETGPKGPFLGLSAQIPSFPGRFPDLGRLTGSGPVSALRAWFRPFLALSGSSCLALYSGLQARRLVFCAPWLRFGGSPGSRAVSGCCGVRGGVFGPWAETPRSAPVTALCGSRLVLVSRSNGPKRLFQLFRA